MNRLAAACLLVFAVACAPDYQADVPGNAAAQAAAGAPAKAARTETAVFAGGCFWCTEADFEKVPGVVSALSGYTGGRTERPTYEQVSANGTGHYEAVLVRYDPAKVSFAQLARYFFRTVDPTDAGGQFCDRGESYRTAIFAAPGQVAAAQAAKAGAEKALGRKVVTPILAAGRFWPAEDYHQDYYRKNGLKYRFYRSRCGRDARLREIWGDAR
ncbi:MAG: peptide-methionine (S)-S-oxide reductase MsrA [Allosphingosinicella sp.]